MVTLTSSTQKPNNAKFIPPYMESKEGKEKDDLLQDELAFQKVLEKARKRIAQKEYYTPEEAYQITMQSIREVYAI